MAPTVGIATAGEQPINRHAAVAGAVFEQGDPVGMNGSGELVKADAATGTAINAVGIAFAPSFDASSYSGVEKLEVEQERALINVNRVSFVTHGVEIENNDDQNAWSFTPGEPVYLGEGGGYTQTKPSDVGDLVQVLGIALEAERVGLAVDYDYVTV